MSSPAAPLIIGRHRVTGRPRLFVRPALAATGLGPVETAPADAPERQAAPEPDTELGNDENDENDEDGREPLWRRAIAFGTSMALITGVVAFAFLALGPHLFGYRTATMLTGSMEPGIMPGDVVVTVPTPAEELAVGDVISYHIPIEDNRVETHRVTEVSTTESGQVSFRTKGDNNPGVDPWTAVVDGDTVWEVRAVIPHVGKVIRAMRVPAVQDGVRWVALGAMILLGLSMIWSRDEDEDDDENDENEDDPAELEDTDERRPAHGGRG